MTKKLLITAAITAATLVGCGGSSSTPPERPAAQIDGTVADNIVRNGDVRVYRWDGQEREILLSTKTDNHGYYADPLRSESQFIKVCITGGEYTEEASSINIKLENGDRLCAVTYWESAQAQEVMVTPETNLAVALMEYEVKAGKGNLQNIVANANSKIGTLFGYDILKTRPADMTSDDYAYTGLNDNIRSGLWHAAFSRLALEAAKTNGQSTHTSLISSMQLHKALYRDLSSDGKLDGWALAENGKTKVRLGLGNYELNAQIYRTELARELVNFVKSDRNKTAVKDVDVLSYANAFSVSTDSIFSGGGSNSGGNSNAGGGNGNGGDGGSDSDWGDEPIPFDEDAPDVSFDTPEGAYIANTYTLGLKVTDFSGVKSVTYTLNGGNVQVFDFTQDELVINTREFEDGDLELALTVVDKIDNTAIVKRTFKVSNTKPVVSLDTKTLVNSSSYDFVANVGEIKAGVASVQVNSRDAEYSDGQITANVRLQEGANIIPVKITETTGLEHTYTFTVTVDTREPSISFKQLPWLYYVKRNENNVSEDRHNTQSATNPLIYVTPNYYKLNNVLPVEENLKALKWPTFKLNIFDTGSEYLTSPEKLIVEYVYTSDGVVDPQEEDHHGTLKVAEDGNVLFPLSEEYLGAAWYEKKGIKRIKLIVTDEAGNRYTNFNISFDVAISAPTIKPEIGGSNLEGSHIRGDVNIDMSGRDLVGADEISITLNGAKKSYITSENTNYSLDTNELSDGLHYIDTVVKTNGITLFLERFEFNVDNTAPAITITSPQLVDSSNLNYTLKGTLSDAGSGVYSSEYRLGEESFRRLNALSTFSQSVRLQSGDNTITVKATDLAGNEAVARHDVLLDDSAPRFNAALKNGKLNGVTREELYSRDYEIFTGYTHDPVKKDLYGVFIGSGGNEYPLYMDDENNNIQNLTTTHVNGAKNALNSDGSLNLTQVEAETFLKNGRGRSGQGIPHLDFTVSDTQYSSGSKADTPVNATDLTVTLDVYVKDKLWLNKKVLLPVFEGATTQAQRYFVPLTKEFIYNENNSKESLTTLGVDDRVKILLTVKDKAGNTRTKTYEFYVFNAPKSTTKPTVTGGLNSTMTNGNLSLSLTTKSNIGLSRVYLNKKVVWDSLDKPNTKTFTTSASANTEGVHNWALEAYDLAGNVVKSSYKGTIDKTKPTVSINKSSIPTYATKSFTLKFAGADNVGVSKYEVNDGTTTKTVTTNSIVLSPPSDNGLKEVKITAYDKAGNKSATVSEKINWMPAPPYFFVMDFGGWGGETRWELHWSLEENANPLDYISKVTYVEKACGETSAKKTMSITPRWIEEFSKYQYEAYWNSPVKGCPTRSLDIELVTIYGHTITGKLERAGMIANTDGEKTGSVFYNAW